MLQDGTNTYVYGLGLISATDGSGNQTYFLHDGLGSTVALTDGSGNVTATYEYDAFGAIRSQTGSASTPWQFTGQQLDADSSLYFLRARYYDPSTGRFLGRDPLAANLNIPGTINRYVYVQNNPLVLTDLTGMDTDVQLYGNIAHAIIEFWYRYNHPGARTEFTYSVPGDTGRIDIVDPRSPTTAVFWEIKSSDQLLEAQRQVARRLKAGGTAAFQQKYHLSLAAGEDYEGLDECVGTLCLHARQSSAGVILYDWDIKPVPFPFPMFWEHNCDTEQREPDWIQLPLPLPDTAPVPLGGTA